jgi:DNA-directed RNA polymerase specialized sigma24 family protein
MEYHHRAMVAKDSLFSEEKNKALTRLEMNFEFERKEASARAEQEKRDLQLEAEINKKKIITTSLIILLAALLAVIILILQKQQLKRKKDKIIFEQERDLLNSEKLRLQSELIHSKKTLDNYTDSMLEKTDMLEKFRTEVEALKNLKSKELYEERIGQLDHLNKITILTDEDWYKFQELFEQVYKGFFVKLKEKLPGLTPAETRLVCLTRLQLSTKQMADVLGVSQDTIKKTRYRLRKKLVVSETEDIDDLVKSI